MRAFDAKADGHDQGIGGGVVVLKRLSQTLWPTATTSVRSVKGSAINNDGARRIGFTAPSVDGQAEVISAALAYRRRVCRRRQLRGDPRHGDDPRGPHRGRWPHPGLPPTDYTDADSAPSAPSRRTSATWTRAPPWPASSRLRWPCEREVLPASLNFSEPNPQIHVQREPVLRQRRGAPMAAHRARHGERASAPSGSVEPTRTSSLRRHPPPRRPDRDASTQLVLVSAKSTGALDTATRRLADHLDAHPEVPLADVSYTLAAGRRRLPCRRAVWQAAASKPQQTLRSGDRRSVLTETRGSQGLPAVFLFPGGGAQYAGMARGLYESEPVFRTCVDRCAAILGSSLAHDVREVMFGGAGDIETPEPGASRRCSRSSTRLAATAGDRGE